MDPQTQLPQQPVSQPTEYQSQLPAIPQLPQEPLQNAGTVSTAPVVDTSLQTLTPAPQYDSLSGQQTEAPPTLAADNVAMMQQIVTTINGAKNVLVTVSIDPSVDELASAVGMTFLLGKLGKHATAVFSGKIPAAMEFLEPETVFEETVDSLRDFIIALDKEKADKLRYKVEEDVVKIFITPYKTILSEKDLEYSQGDFNVDVVLALGVTKREELDKAITAHGRILHDATVVTVNAGGSASGLGALDWHDPEASSVAEMLVLLSEELGNDQFDAQISTAFLTGLVAQTNRFSNDKTSPKVMTTAAQLMATGANQQLIATNLRHEGMISEPVRAKESNQPHNDDGEMVLEHKDTKYPKKVKKSKKSSSNTEKSVPNDPPPIQQEGEQPQEETEPSSGLPDKTLPHSAEDTQSDTGDDQSLVGNSAPAKLEETPAESLRSTLVKSPSITERSVVDSAPIVIEPLPQSPPLANSTAIDTAPEVVEQPFQQPVERQDSNDDDSLTLPPPIPQKIDATRPHKVIEPLADDADVDEAEAPTIGDLKAPIMMPEAPVTEAQKPSFGGTLNATAAEAEADTAAQKQRDQGSLSGMPYNNEASVVEDEKAALDLARSAVEDAADSAIFSPANHPVESLNASPMAEIVTPTNDSASTGVTSPIEEPSPVEDFMQPHVEQAPIQVPPAFGAEPQMAGTSIAAGPPATVVQPMMPPTVPANPGSGSLPPLPPMPGGTSAGMMPPMPPMPGQSTNSAAASTQPQVTPAFMDQVSQSQNSLTKAGEEVAQKYAKRDADRQVRKDDMNQRYGAAVEQNQVLQEQAAINAQN